MFDIINTTTSSKMGICNSTEIKEVKTVDQGVQTLEITPVEGLNPEHKATLEKRDYRDLKVHSNEGRILYAKVVSVYDGDTVQIVIINHGNEERYKFRMYGYDTPEMKPSKNNTLRELEKKAALVTKEFLCKLVLDKVIIVKFNKEEKYGRQMGEIFLEENGPSVNSIMVSNGLAKPYFGKTKTVWTEDELRRICSRCL